MIYVAQCIATFYDDWSTLVLGAFSTEEKARVAFEAHVAEPRRSCTTRGRDYLCELEIHECELDVSNSKGVSD